MQEFSAVLATALGVPYGLLLILYAVAPRPTVWDWLCLGGEMAILCILGLIAGALIVAAIFGTLTLLRQWLGRRR